MKTNPSAINKLHESKLYLHFYEDFLNQERTDRECQFIFEKCSLQKNKKLLDLACGHGRHSIGISELGLVVTGLDMNPDFIRMANETAAKKSLIIDFIEGDILKMENNAEFDTIILLYNSFGFFNRSDGKVVMNLISKALKPGGRLLLDVKNKENVPKEIESRQTTRKGNDSMIDRISYEPIEGIVTNNRIYIKDGKKYNTPFSMQLYSYNELNELGQQNNFRIVNSFGSWKGEAWRSDARRIILIFEKNEDK